MPYVLSLTQSGNDGKHFDTVSDAVAFYEKPQNEGALLSCWTELKCPRKNTFVHLFPGISVQMAEDELESVWEWEPEDRLKIRPRLKMRYRTTT